MIQEASESPGRGEGRQWSKLSPSPITGIIRELGKSTLSSGDTPARSNHRGIQISSSVTRTLGE